MCGVVFVRSAGEGHANLELFYKLAHLCKVNDSSTLFPSLLFPQWRCAASSIRSPKSRKTVNWLRHSPPVVVRRASGLKAESQALYRCVGESVCVALHNFHANAASMSATKVHSPRALHSACLPPPARPTSLGLPLCSSRSFSFYPGSVWLSLLTASWPSRPTHSRG